MGNKDKNKLQQKRIVTLRSQITLNENTARQNRRELEFKRDEEEYAIVVRMLGNGRCEAMCMDGKKRLCHIRGNIRKRFWISVNDVVLIALREYQDYKAGIIWKFYPGEVKDLIRYGEIPDSINKEQDGDHGFNFGNSIVFEDDD
ncbi:Translation initiation factor 1A (eIF-1A) [Corchorus capsularis]|uniref:Eukaryotic translation initiation factor 4C n=1 Tax=Corchorus capsularis TaxID=210143 RepID=A0A1R3H298_COCAP|nr:Translation initiation factor 1A (eIF-1A) [Corchorus capsularis]